MKRCQREKRNDKFTKRKTPIDVKNKIAVPNYVKSYYRNPPSLLPGTGHERWLKPETRHGGDTKEMEWVSGLVFLQTDFLKNIVNKKDKNDKISKEDEVEEEAIKEEKDDDTDLKCNESLEEDDMSQSVSPSSTTSTSSLVTMLSEYLAQHSHHDINSLDPVVVQYLAHRQLQTMMSHDRPGADPSSVVQARASLTPLHSRKSPVLMKYRTLNIGAGAGSGSGLDLSQYGHCNYLSNKHATIF